MQTETLKTPVNLYVERNVLSKQDYRKTRDPTAFFRWASFVTLGFFCTNLLMRLPNLSLTTEICLLIIISTLLSYLSLI